MIQATAEFTDKVHINSKLKFEKPFIILSGVGGENNPKSKWVQTEIPSQAASVSDGSQLQPVSSPAIPWVEEQQKLLASLGVCSGALGEREHCGVGERGLTPAHRGAQLGRHCPRQGRSQ